MITTGKGTRVALLFVRVASCLALLAVPHVGAAPTRLAPEIVLDHASGPPGSQVVVQGSGFATPETGWIIFQWDAIGSPSIGSASLGTDGSLIATVTIPPNATAGTHSIIAVHSDSGEQASATFSVAGAKLRAAYVYNTDLSKAEAFKTLLEYTGMLDTDIVQLGNVPTTDLSIYDLILVGSDTGSGGAWGTSASVARIRDSGKPILGLGEGGYGFFGALSLHIGYPHGSHFSSNTTQVRAVDTSHPIYQTPYMFTSPVTVYNADTTAVEIYDPPAATLKLGRDMLQDDYYPLVQEAGRYFLWGFDGGPGGEMSEAGELFFVNVVWHVLRVRTDVDTLILVDYQRMKDIGYPSAEVDVLEGKVNSLVSQPKSVSNMTAVVKRLNLDAPEYVRQGRASWAGNEDFVSPTNLYVSRIAGYVRSLKQGLYPNLQYLILVGAHEVIPMEAREVGVLGAAQGEMGWADTLPQKSGYLYSLYHTPGANNMGHYLSDSIYGDLSYIDNGYGTGNEVIPELAVGRLVETPVQIGQLLDNYVAGQGFISPYDMSAIGSWDLMDAAQAVADLMKPRAGTFKRLIQADFDSSLVSSTINTGNDIVYIAGHGEYNSIATGQSATRPFWAGDHLLDGDVEELNDMPNSVVVAPGCHNGVNLGNKLYHDYDTYTYADFPEQFASKGVGVYLATTAFGTASYSGSSTDTSQVCGTELLSSLFVQHLLCYDPVTAGQANKAAVNDYVKANVNPISCTLDELNQRTLAMSTLYGIPNYRVARYGGLLPGRTSPYLPIDYWIEQGQTATPMQVVMRTTYWNVEANGLINIRGTLFTGEDGQPILPLVYTSQVLPVGSRVVNVTWNQAESESVTILNDVPLAVVGIASTPVLAPTTFSYEGFYPPTLCYTSTLSTLGGGAAEVGLTIMPVQYDPSAHQTRIWTKLVFDVEYEVDGTALGTDSDGDDLPDYWESGYGLSPNDASGDQGTAGDPDQDGLTNFQEHGLGTDPLDPDTDRDGVSDEQEVGWGTDPLNPGSRPIILFLPLTLRSYAGAAAGE